MTLLKLNHVIKQQDQHIILKNIGLSVAKKQRLGLKMTQVEALMLFDLIEGQQATSSGTIQRDYQLVMSDRKTDALYHHLTVKKYLTYFKEIANNPIQLTDLFALFSLIDIAEERIKNLSLSQQKRISLARIFLFQPELVLIESPISEFSNSGIELYLRSLEAFSQLETAIIFTANYIEDLLILSHSIYTYQEEFGLVSTDLVQPEDSAPTLSVDEAETNFQEIFKVSCKIADKTIFFDPIEIDYIESINSISTISVAGEQFPTTLTMNELEQKLKAFGFFRSHRSYLVNLQRISELISYSRNSFTLILKGQDQAKIPLSRSRLDDFKNIMDF